MHERATLPLHNSRVRTTNELQLLTQQRVTWQAVDWRSADMKACSDQANFEGAPRAGGSSANPEAGLKTYLRRPLPCPPEYQLNRRNPTKSTSDDRMQPGRSASEKFAGWRLGPTKLCCLNNGAPESWSLPVSVFPASGPNTKIMKGIHYEHKITASTRDFSVRRCVAALARGDPIALDANPPSGRLFRPHERQ